MSNRACVFLRRARVRVGADLRQTVEACIKRCAAESDCLAFYVNIVSESAVVCRGLRAVEDASGEGSVASFADDYSYVEVDKPTTATTTVTMTQTTTPTSTPAFPDAVVALGDDYALVHQGTSCKQRTENPCKGPAGTRFSSAKAGSNHVFVRVPFVMPRHALFPSPTRCSQCGFGRACTVHDTSLAVPCRACARHRQRANAP